MPRSQLGDSWGGISDDSDGEYRAGWPAEDAREESRKKPSSRRTNAAADRSPEPQLIMPSLDEDTLSSSRFESPSKRTRSSRAPKSSEKAREPRQRPRGRAQDKQPSNHTESIPSPKNHRPLTSHPSPDFFETTMNHVGALISWALSVVGQALRILKTPIAYLLAIYLLFTVGVVTRNFVTNSVTNSIYASFSPVCSLPGVSLLNLPICPSSSLDNGKPAGPPEFEKLMTVQSQFEEVMETTAGGASLPLDMKRSEASVRDLRTLVKFSQLYSKQELVLEFDGFIETAKIASYDLQRFNSHVGRAVDTVLSTTRWTSRVLDGIALRDSQRGAIEGFTDKALSIFKPVKYTERALVDQYIQHTHVVEGEIHKLISEAQALLLVLTNLEDRLDIIHGIVTRDDILAKNKKEEILADLWTMLGGNRSKISKMDKELALLTQVGNYRKTAMAHVSGTILKLQEMSAGLEDLRERVGGPELLRDRLDIPLEVHLENILRGVERLEAGRESARKIERDIVNRVVRNVDEIEAPRATLA